MVVKNNINYFFSDVRIVNRYLLRAFKPGLNVMVVLRFETFNDRHAHGHECSGIALLLVLVFHWNHHEFFVQKQRFSRGLALCAGSCPASLGGPPAESRGLEKWEAP